MWDGPTFQTYYLQIDRIIVQSLNNADPQYLLEVDPEEYLSYLVSEAEFQTLEWDEGQKTIEPFSVKRERRSDFTGHHIVTDEHRFRIRIPISAHPQRKDYFKYGPSTTWAGTSEPAWTFERDVLVFDVEATEQAVQQGVEAVRFWLGNRNNDIESGNKQLRDRIRPVWERKRKQLEEQHGAVQSLLQKLSIPLHQDPDARPKPTDIKPRQLRTVVQKPLATAKVGPTLSHDDVVLLVDFIEQYAKQFEVSPKTFAKMDEEELRDLIIGMMNTNYPGSTTGETFSKLGKTDISFRLDAGHILICECKFWPGPKGYEEALDQLFTYLTWRHNYAVMITFCRLKDMSKAISGASQAMRDHPSFVTGNLHAVSDTRFLTRHAHPQDSRKMVEIHHLFFDLSI